MNITIRDFHDHAWFKLKNVSSQLEMCQTPNLCILQVLQEGYQVPANGQNWHAHVLWRNGLQETHNWSVFDQTTVVQG